MSSTHPRSGIRYPLVSRRACPRDGPSAYECPEILLPLYWRGAVRSVWQKKTYLPCQIPINLPVYAVSYVDGAGVRYYLHERHLVLTLPGMVQPPTRGLITGGKTLAPHEQMPSGLSSIASYACYQGTELELRPIRNDGSDVLGAYFLTSVACVIVELGARAGSR